MGYLRDSLHEMRGLMRSDLYERVGPNGEGGEVWEAPGGAVRVVLTPIPEDDRVECLVVIPDRTPHFTDDGDAGWLEEKLP